MRESWAEVPLGDLISVVKTTVQLRAGVSYPAAGVMMEGRGLIDREPFIGGESGYKKLTPIVPGQLVLRSITAWEAPITVVPDGFIGRHVSGVFPVFEIDSRRLLPGYMRIVCQWPEFWNQMRTRAIGTVLRRKTLNARQLMEIRILLPSTAEQRRIVDLVSAVDEYITALQRQADAARTARNAVLHELLTCGGDDWTETTLGEVAELNPKEKALVKSAPFAPMDAVSVGKRFVTYFEPRGDRGGARANDGDVLFARITPCLENGKVAQVPSGTGRCGGSTEFIVIRGGTKANSDFLYFWATWSETRSRATDLMTGTTGRQRLSWPDLAGMRIQLPPTREQMRIVEIITSMDEVIEALDVSNSQAKELRSGLLSDLLSGEHEIPASYDRLLGAA